MAAVELNWKEALAAYRSGLAGGGSPLRVVKRYLAAHGPPGSSERANEVQARLDELLEAAEEIEPVAAPSPPDPAPLPPPSAPASQVESTAPLSAPERRAEPDMPSPDLGAAIARAIPVALSLYQVAHDSGAIDEIGDAISGVAKRARRLARRGPLDEAARSELCREAREEIRCVLPQLTEEALETIGEIAIDAIDEHTSTGPLEEVDGPLAKRGLAALLERLDIWSSDPGNLDARAERARRQAARAAREAERLERIAARKRARG